jgi:hypothetical protein
MKLTLGIAIAGLVLMTAGFLVDQATHIPLVLRIVAPQYVRANAAAQTLFAKNELNRSESGFDDLAELYISQLPKRPPPDLFPTSFTREANTTTLTDEGPVTMIHMKWTGGQETTCIRSILKRVSTHRWKPPSRFGDLSSSRSDFCWNASPFFLSTARTQVQRRSAIPRLKQMAANTRAAMRFAPPAEVR